MRLPAILLVVLGASLVAVVGYDYKTKGSLTGWFQPPAPPADNRRLAPEGTFFITEYVSTKIPGGVAGFPPGTRVTLKAERSASMVISDGKYEIEVRPDQITNDLDVAEAARRNDAQSQARLAAYVASQNERARLARERWDLEHSQAVSDFERRTIAASSSKSPSRLDEPATRDGSAVGVLYTDRFGNPITARRYYYGY